LSDIHEDLESLEKAFRAIERQGCDEIACLGDISGYGAPHYSYPGGRDAHQCLSLVKKNCKYTVLGNHDLHAGEIIPRKGNIFDFPEDWYRLDYPARRQLVKNKIWLHEENDLDPMYTAADIDYLKSLPEYIVIGTGKQKILLSHYVYPNLSGLSKFFFTYADEFAQHFSFMKKHDCNISFTGHSHARGMFVAHARKIRKYRQGHTVKKFPVCIGILPVTRSMKKNGFCIYDTREGNVKIVRLKQEG
jgi:predicted phosphodiesterase